ncbi:MAG: hypothetical protein GX207_09820 [Peptococcaceae bacterium]|nr:hypothetical protein [Peptococcaceae bacterium]
MRHQNFGYRSSLLKKIEKVIIRVAIACTVLLALFQLRFITDPVEFYLKIAGDIDTPAFKYSQYVAEDKTVTLYFNTNPDSPVLVKQNGEILGVIGQGLEIKVKQGTVDLDASGIPYPVTVDIIYNEKKHSLNLHGNIKSFTLEVKSSSVL